MATPPATITMAVEDWAVGQKEQFSPVHRINGFPFRLRMKQDECRAGLLVTSVVCDKSREAELWECSTTITEAQIDKEDEDPIGHVFCSWEQQCEVVTGSIDSTVGSSLQVTIVVEEGKNSWSSSSLRPSPDSIEPPNGIIEIGEEKKEVQVNKEFLASQSPYFDVLFLGNFMEKNMDEIPIRNVEYKEFKNIIRIVYGSSNAVLKDKIVNRILDLADRFELKIVEDKVVSYIRSRRSHFSLAKKLLISEERNLPILKKLCLSDDYYKIQDVSKIKDEPEYADFSVATKLEILDRMMDLALECDCDC